MLRFSLDDKLPEQFEVGSGNVLPISGWCFHPDHRIRKLFINMDSKRYEFDHPNLLRTDIAIKYARVDKFGQSLTSGFLLLLPISKEWARSRVAVTLGATISRRHEEIVSLGTTEFISYSENAAVSILDLTEKPRIAICLSTFNPDLDLFRKQVQSLRAQNIEDWVCIVQDDCSSPKTYMEIQNICQVDRRFHVFRSSMNSGFYKNFELALRRVPAEVPFVALCDQDDSWYPNKLERTLEGFTHDSVQLVYCDMKLVDRIGGLFSNTYWTNRRNNHVNLESILLANTVTGAASIFRRSLLEVALPFPPQVGEVFHDHWLACVARSKGRIEYIPEPLYDYVQHGLNVVGHCDIRRKTLREMLHSIGSLLFLRPRHWLEKLKRTCIDLQGIYRNDFLRLSVIRLVLELRISKLKPDIRAALNLFKGNLNRSIALLTTVSIRTTLRRDTTNHAEIRLGLSSLNQKLLKFCGPVISKPFIGKNVARQKQISAEIAQTITGLQDKVRPLCLHVSKSEPRRINIVIPEVNFGHFFGGYIGKFNFAMKLTEIGQKVRLLLVDPCELRPNEWRQAIRKYPGLEGFFSKIEVEYCLPRSKPIACHPTDIFVATTWWTAHIAHAATKDLISKRFIYLIQEYEPFTFSMGTHFALANQSYSFPHFALFSTELLQEYFASNQIGVYGESGSGQALYFNNAILPIQPSMDKMNARMTKRLLLYARPEPHAARNMFDVAVGGLMLAIKHGCFDGADWEFHGIGASVPARIDLGDGKTLEIFGKVSLQEYGSLLTEYDVGLSLMYTPHPSLLPLEMAAAGMVVLTNSCLNKTPERLAAISENIIAASPTLEGITAGLTMAVERVKDYKKRFAAATVNWPTAWSETFDEQKMKEIVGWINSDVNTTMKSILDSGNSKPTTISSNS